MAYDAPGGGIGRYARPTAPWVAGTRYVRVDARTDRVTYLWPMAQLWPMMRRVAVAGATRALRC
eukprot:3567412-Prymnesium_polylepis.1